MDFRSTFMDACTNRFSKNSPSFQDAHQIMFREFATTKTNITILSMIDPITYLVDSQDSNYDRFSTFVHQNVRRLKVGT